MRGGRSTALRLLSKRDAMAFCGRAGCEPATRVNGCYIQTETLPRYPMALGQSLFRREAIDFQRGQRDFGEIALLQPVSTKLLAWVLTAVVAAAIVFLCFAQFSRKQTVAGFLIPAAGTMKVFPTREGVVSELHVKECQRVKAGDPLFTVVTSEVAADGEDVNAAKLASMRHQKEMLEGQIAAEQRTAAAELDRLEALIASSEAEIGDIRRQIDIQEKRIQI